jgi:hypothetical protein
VPSRFNVHALIFSNDAVALETAIHHRFATQPAQPCQPPTGVLPDRLRPAKRSEGPLGPRRTRRPPRRVGPPTRERRM